MIIPPSISKQFQSIYKSEPLIIRSPGRINLIGEHTDYNDGFVLPAAIDKAIYLGFVKNNLQECRVYSLDFQEEETFLLKEMYPRKGWINFIMGVTAQVKAAGYAIEGFDCVFGGDIPIGAGLSSSAALENGVGYGLSELFCLNLEKLDMIQFSQKAENEFVGLNCGIMDMFASMMGKKDHAIKLDCRSLDYDYFPVKLGKYEFLLCDSQVSHSLANSAYNKRREECELGVKMIRTLYPQVKNLRDVDLRMLESQKKDLPAKVFDRCDFVIRENKRLIKSCEALDMEDLVTFGEMLYGSHLGLSKNYEVSCEELDFLVEKTQGMPFVLGARMMGGGFGGCTLNLVEIAQRETFITSLSDAYREQFGKSMKVYEVRIEDGTSLGQ
ncbi:MAG: galactokinase [Cyclobacteriaceae bacterium]